MPESPTPSSSPETPELTNAELISRIAEEIRQEWEDLVDWKLCSDMKTDLPLEEGTQKVDYDTLKTQVFRDIASFKCHLPKSYKTMLDYAEQNSKTLEKDEEGKTALVYSLAVMGEMAVGEGYFLKQRTSAHTKSVLEEETDKLFSEEDILHEMVSYRIHQKIENNNINQQDLKSKSTGSFWAQIKSTITTRNLTNEERKQQNKRAPLVRDMMKQLSPSEIALIAQQQMKGIWHSTVKQVNNK